MMAAYHVFVFPIILKFSFDYLSPENCATVISSAYLMSHSCTRKHQFSLSVRFCQIDAFVTFSTNTAFTKAENTLGPNWTVGRVMLIIQVIHLDLYYINNPCNFFQSSICTELTTRTSFHSDIFCLSIPKTFDISGKKDQDRKI